jgi:hypothetical protein
VGVPTMLPKTGVFKDCGQCHPETRREIGPFRPQFGPEVTTILKPGRFSQDCGR